ncbi:Polynucleotide 5'-hydroxyl-kinase NOL9 [Platanthera guangdongensis]|uniref:Polynucleotide 5'-hydroxyl-kinase NOL9 n=1 Tax=Platanthera guangdongensis TaxID=2320717 RepID=A0ABR2M6T4_9ASPA
MFLLNKIQKVILLVLIFYMITSAKSFTRRRRLTILAKFCCSLIINTSMWVKSTSYEILVAMLRHISPTHVVNVCFPSETENFPSGQFWLENPHRESVNLVQIFAANESSIQM